MTVRERERVRKEEADLDLPDLSVGNRKGQIFINVHMEYHVKVRS